MKVLIALLSFLLSSCALMPYSNETLCHRGKEGGLCGRISDVYEYVNKEEKNEKTVSDYLVP